MLSVVAAICKAKNGVPSVSVYCDSATGTVWSVSTPEVNTSGTRNEFQLARKVRTASVASAGRASGRATAPEDAELAEAVDPAGVCEVARQGQEELAHQEGAHHGRHAEDGLDEQRQVCAHPAEAGSSARTAARW